MKKNWLNERCKTMGFIKPGVCEPKIVSSVNVGMFACVCMCVCVSAPEGINNKACEIHA